MDRNFIQKEIDRVLEEHDAFLVEFKLSADNRINIYVDSMQGVNLRDLKFMSRAIENYLLDNQEEDFALEVSSPGLDKPLKVFKQYQKNVGRHVKITLNEGEKVAGKLVNVTEEEVVLEEEKRVKKETGKGKMNIVVTHNIPFENILETKLEIKF